MTVTWKYSALIIALLLSGGHSVSAAEPKVQATAATNDAWIENTAEVPIESIQQFVKIYGVVKENYVSEKSDEDLFLQATKGLVSGLDRYSRYLSPEEYRQLVQYTEGDLATVDFKVVFDVNRAQWVVRELSEDDDSSKLGLTNGSPIYKIDYQELRNISQTRVNELLEGSFGSTLQIQQYASGPSYTLVRNQKLDVADIQAVLLQNQILVLKVRVFQQDTANEIKKLIDVYQSHNIKGVLIDLRNNPGGLLSSAVETADLFLNQGLIVSTKSRSEGDQEFQALPSQESFNIKLGVLINGRSASAAEVFTAAMKEHQRAVILGEKSYGKGVVQKLFPIGNGAALQMTVSHYLTPKGNLIDGVGIRPNIELPWTLEMKEELYLNIASEQMLKSK